MRRVLATSVLVVAGLFVTACSDQHSPLPTEPPLSPSLTGRSCTSPLQLAALTVALFAPGDLLTFARSTQSTINLKMSRGDIAGARKLALAFVDFTLKSYYQGKLRDPNGDKPPTTAEAAVTLIDGVLCWVGLPPSGLDLTKKADITVTTKVIGKDGGELVAGDKLSGLKVEQGTVSEDALWVITRRDDLAKNGTCVSTTLTQIPLCIDFSVVPAQQVAKPLLVVICQPEDRHPLNRRLAHKLPDNKVELLAVQPDPFSVGVDRSGLDCTNSSDFPPPGSSSLGRAVWQFGSLVMRVLGPKRLHAGHSGLGGLLGPKLSPVTAVEVVLKFRQQPTNTESDHTITPAVTVAYTDSLTGAVATEVTNPIRIAIGSDPNETRSTLSGTTTQTPSAGLATFDNLSIDQTGKFTLVADGLSPEFTGSEALGIPVTSNPFETTGAPTSTSLTTSWGLLRFDQADTLIATVSPAPPGGERPLVEFFDGATSLGIAPRGVSGNFKLTMASLSLAAHSLTAHFLGTASSGPSTSSVFIQHVIRRFDTPEDFSTALGGASMQTQDFSNFVLGDPVSTLITGVLTLNSPFELLNVRSCGDVRGVFGSDAVGNPTRTAGRGRYDLTFLTSRNALGFEVLSQDPATSPALIDVVTTVGSVTFPVSNTSTLESTPTFLGMIATLPLTSVAIREGFENVLNPTVNEEVCIGDFSVSSVTLP